MPTLSLAEFIHRWQTATLTEQSAAQSHFLDLCAVLDQPTPAQADPTGTWYTFERGVTKTGGGARSADDTTPAGGPPGPNSRRYPPSIPSPVSA